LLNNSAILSSLRILYVEDDLNTREEVSFFLEGIVAELYLASNGKEGYEKYCTYLPDLIITDIQMPKMNGIEMIEKLRETDPYTPVLITSAYNETNYLLNAINIGVERYILKPINLKLLVEAIKDYYVADKRQHFYLSVDSNGDILDVNTPLLKLLGYKKNELQGHPVVQYIEASHREQFETYLSELIDGKNDTSIKIILTDKDGLCIETVCHLWEKTSVSPDEKIIKIEFKNIDAYVKNEAFLNKLLKSERFTKDLIRIQALINEAIVSASDKSVFLQNIVDLFVQIDDFEFAYSAFSDDKNSLNIVAQSTHEKFDMISHPPQCLGMSLPNSCPLLEVVNSQKMIVIENVETFATCQSEKYVSDNKILSMIILPIRGQLAGRADGALNLLLTKVFKVEQESLKLFENISDLIALGLQAIENRVERHNLQLQLRRERDFTSSILDSAGVIIMVINQEGVIVRFNKTAERFSGHTSMEVVGIPYFWKNFLLSEELAKNFELFDSVRCENDTKYFESHLLSKNGEKSLFEWTNTLLKDEKGDTEYLIAIGNDITQRKQNEEIIKHLAFYDPLTQLPNRRLLRDRLTKAMAMSKRSGSYGAVMFLDLDNFKPLNDIYGHTIGDLLLIEVAKRLKFCIRETDTVARFGGDEFIVLLSEIDKNKENSVENAAIVAEKIRSTLAEEYAISSYDSNGKEIVITHYCTCSAGIAFFHGHDRLQDDLLKYADSAMYTAKKQGRNKVYFYSAEDTPS